MVLKEIPDIDEDNPEALERELGAIKKELKSSDIKSKLENLAEKIQEYEIKKDKKRL